jgi:hypothetical protein
MAVPYEDIVELAEAHIRKANLYLEHGYQLISVQGISYEKPRREPSEVAGGSYIQRRIRYVLGRPQGVDHYEPPDWEPEAASGQESIAAPA